MKIISEKQLAAAAKRFREASGKTRSMAARELNVSHVSALRAEESPELSLAKLRMRIIKRYSRYRVVGPVYILKEK